jgi:hypothetical protein
VFCCNIKAFSAVENFIFFSRNIHISLVIFAFMENTEKWVTNIPGRTKRSIAVSQSGIGDHGRIPPQAVDLEEAVLGAMMLEQNALTNVVDILKPEVFYKEAHQKILRQFITFQRV